MTDVSSRHNHLQLRQLNWFSSLYMDGMRSVRDMMTEADPDFIFGADIVR